MDTGSPYGGPAAPVTDQGEAKQSTEYSKDGQEENGHEQG